MLRALFASSYRVLLKQRLYAFINVFGLSLALAATLIILLYVRFERSYDEWLPDADRTFQFQNWILESESGEPRLLQTTSYASAQRLKADFPQVESVVHVRRGTTPSIARNGEFFAVEDMLYADGPLFDILRVPFRHGDARHALRRPGTVVIDETTSRRFFGTDNPVGRPLTLVNGGASQDYVITGVIRDMPSNSHIALPVVARHDPAVTYANQPEFFSNWGWQSGYVYVRLRSGADARAINEALPAWERRNIPDRTVNGQRYNSGDRSDWRLVNVRDVHLGEAQERAMRPGNDRQTIAAFLLIAAAILGMACINFANLATALASRRAREVALRKVLGASRNNLILQFLGEALALAMLATLFALAIVEMAMPQFSRLFDIRIAVSYTDLGGIPLMAAGLALVAGIVGGLYPAMLLSRFKPAMILKANQSSGRTSGSARLRNILVAGQFAVTIALLTCTAIIFLQTSYARTLDAGYQREGLIQVENLRRGEVAPMLDALRQQIARIDGVRAVGFTEIKAGQTQSKSIGARGPDQREPIQIGLYGISDGMLEAMGIRLLAGRPLSSSRPLDNVEVELTETESADAILARRGVNVLVNRTGARALGFADPGEAVGKVVRTSMVDPAFGEVPATIVGVIPDVRFRSIRAPIEPTLLALSPGSVDTMVVRYASVDPGLVMERLRSVWRAALPDMPVEPRFADDIVRNIYAADDARGVLFTGFALLAVVIACLGLFGLSAFTAENRTKEIGIRKVLGARARDIVRLLAWQFSKPVIVANLIGWPIAWWAMRNWLDTFDTRIELGPAPFLAAGILTLIIAIGTVAGHALRVARTNPIHALRYE